MIGDLKVEKKEALLTAKRGVIQAEGTSSAKALRWVST